MQDVAMEAFTSFRDEIDAFVSDETDLERKKGEAHQNLARCDLPIEEGATAERILYLALEPLAPYNPDIRKKQQVSNTSLRKVEDTAYTMQVRSSEYSDPAMMQELVRRALQSNDIVES
ncbi:hypothetical protein MPSI1_000322 [Malassezia psittaci]|uniref:Uncharacterized protein n=1 Tax=Malassezia psittaci TaxID=1821823 RepID=A0AAF0F313_9BASI|nr:hypothetical protein MPSI1_000322 [Malassezia psittaci]